MLSKPLTFATNTLTKLSKRFGNENILLSENATIYYLFAGRKRSCYLTFLIKAVPKKYTVDHDIAYGTL